MKQIKQIFFRKWESGFKGKWLTIINLLDAAFSTDQYEKNRTWIELERKYHGERKRKHHGEY